MLEKIIFVTGSCILILLVTLILIEVLIRLKEKISDFVYPDKFTDNFHPNYHKYINYYASWDDALFSYDQIIGFRLLNDKNKKFQNFIKINKLGFRTHEFNELGNDDEFSIIFNGGSAAFGSGASSNEHMISTYLENKLNKISKKKVRVYNLAQINNFQTQEILTLIFLFNKIKPKIVISFNGWNELTANNIMNDKTIKSFELFNITELEGWKPGLSKSIIKKNFINSNYIFLNEYLKSLKYLPFINASSFSRRDRDRKNFRSFNEGVKVGSKLYLKNMDLFNKISKGFNFKYFAFLQPYITKKNLTQEEKKLLEYRRNENPLLKDEDMIDEIIKMDNLYKFIDGKNDNIYNLYNFFGNESSNIFYNMVHLNDKGQEMIAKKIFETIKNEIPN